MQKSEQIEKLAAALAAVQMELGPAIKDSNNPFFKSKYADLNSVWDACSDKLAKHGLSVAQFGDSDSEALNGSVPLTTLLMHSSGQWIAGTMRAPLSKADAQGVGSCITYLRRYGLQAMIGIRAEDDDGNAASETPKEVGVVVRNEVRGRYGS